jgi:hypothetical protein
MKEEILRKMMKNNEKVNHPSHYGGDTIYETIKVLEAWLPREQFIGFLLGNKIKYDSRAGKKESSTQLEDLKKSHWYSRYLTDYLERTKK